MLDIASYGYASKRLSSWVGSGSTRSSSRSEEMPDALRHKRRAESTGPSNRESFYMDREQAEDENMVLDETPLTDMEDHEPDEISYYFDTHEPRPESPPLPTSYDLVPPSRTSSRTQPSPAPVVSKIPTPSHPPMSSDPPWTPTPLGPPLMSRGVSEPLPSTSSPVAQSSNQGWRSQPPTKASIPHTPKTPGKNIPSSSKTNGAAKKSSKPPPVSMKQAKQGEGGKRGSIAVYPTPDGEDIENAIPSWTRPVENSNWDDVVLPVVARKKGLDGQYETTDGAAKTKAARENVPEPAPGTFGYDHSKYKPPRIDYEETTEEIQMDDLGQQKEVEAIFARQEQQPIGLAVDEHRPIHPMGTLPKSRSSSPAPFARYTPNSDPLAAEKKHDDYLQKRVDDGDGGSGCCKCVIM